MTTITIHGDRTPDGRPGGKPRTGLMSSRDPLVAAQVAKAVVRKGKWRTLPGRDDQAKILTAISNEARWALLALPPEVIEALPVLGMDLSQVGCSWCAAAVQRSPEPELPRTETLLALLGNGCQACQRRWQKAEATRASAAAEGEHLSMLTAGGGSVAQATRVLERARRLVGGRKPAPPSYYTPGRPR